MPSPSSCVRAHRGRPAAPRHLRLPGPMLTVLALVTLAACTPGADADEPTPLASPTAEAGVDPVPLPSLTAEVRVAPAPRLPSAADVRASGTPLVTGDVTVWIADVDPAVPVAAAAQDDGSTSLTVTPPPPVGPVAVLAGPPGTIWTPLDDGSVVLLAARTPVAGLEPVGATRLDAVASAPGSTSGGADVRVRGGPGDTVVLAATGPEGTAVGATLGASALLDASWGEREGGRSLAVTPADWVRDAGAAARELLWAQLVAREPEADTPSMRAQLECHELGAPDKDTWNLEPWRPDVTAIEMVAARCNP